MANNNNFEGEIRVASQIVDYLSSGLYESPSACLKELVNNSYDADATEVNVYVKPDADRIIIEDNGHGMNRTDFEKHFKMISESYKRESSETTDSGRPKIGKIGIGFIAANEICDVMEIISTKANSDKVLKVSINFAIMRINPVKRKRDNNDIAKADYEGKVEKTDKYEEHFTHIHLKEIRGEAQSILAFDGTSSYSSGEKSLYGLKPESECRIFKDESIKSWSYFDSYSQNRLEVALNVPVQYHDSWVPKEVKSDIEQFEKRLSDLNFTLFFDNSEIRKPIVFNPQKKYFISNFDFEGQHVSAKGYFYVQHGAIYPQELQGVLLRIRNAAIGGYDPNFLDFPSTRGKIFQQWISGEIYADDRLEEAMNIDRRTLRVAFPAYIELQNAIHKQLDNLITRARKELYGAGADERKQKKARGVERKIKRIADNKISNISKETAKQINKSWKNVSKKGDSRKILLKKYSVDEFYDIVIEVAEKFLDKEQLSKFLKLLTEHLKK